MNVKRKTLKQLSVKRSEFRREILLSRTTAGIPGLSMGVATSIHSSFFRLKKKSGKGTGYLLGINLFRRYDGSVRHLLKKSKSSLYSLFPFHERVTFLLKYVNSQVELLKHKIFQFDPAPRNFLYRGEAGDRKFLFSDFGIASRLSVLDEMEDNQKNLQSVEKELKDAVNVFLKCLVEIRDDVCIDNSSYCIHQDEKILETFAANNLKVLILEKRFADIFKENKDSKYPGDRYEQVVKLLQTLYQIFQNKMRRLILKAYDYVEREKIEGGMKFAMKNIMKSLFMDSYLGEELMGKGTDMKIKIQKFEKLVDESKDMRIVESKNLKIELLTDEIIQLNKRNRNDMLVVLEFERKNKELVKKIEEMKGRKRKK